MWLAKIASSILAVSGTAGDMFEHHIDVRGTLERFGCSVPHSLRSIREHDLLEAGAFPMSGGKAFCRLARPALQVLRLVDGDDVGRRNCPVLGSRHRLAKSRMALRQTWQLRPQEIRR